MTVVFLFLLLILALIVTAVALLVRKNRILMFLVIASGVLTSIAAFAVFIYVIEHNTM